MKQLTCEMCGSTEMMKQDGVFVCQTCGTKYTVEEAKKMMIEGTVEVTGTVKIDKSSRINNMLENAVNEFNLANNDKVIALCTEILNEDPSNYRAIIYKGLSTGWKSSVTDCNMSIAVTELERAVKELRKQEQDENIFTDLCKEPIIGLQNLGNAVLKMYHNYFNNCKAQYDQRQKEYNETHAKADSYRWSNLSLCEVFRNQAVQMGKDNRAFYNEFSNTTKNGFISTVTGLNNFIICVFNCINDSNNVSKGFYTLIEEYTSSYSGYIYDENKKQYNDILSHCENLKEEYNDYQQEKFLVDNPEIAKKVEQILEETRKLQEEAQEYANKSADYLKLAEEILAKGDEELDCEEASKKKAILVEINNLTNEKAKLGLFKIKEKHAIQIQIDEMESEIEGLEEIISKKTSIRNAELAKQAEELNEQSIECTKKGEIALEKADRKREECESLLAY